MLKFMKILGCSNLYFYTILKNKSKQLCNQKHSKRPSIQCSTRIRGTATTRHCYYLEVPMLPSFHNIHIFQTIKRKKWGWKYDTRHHDARKHNLSFRWTSKRKFTQSNSMSNKTWKLIQYVWWIYRIVMNANKIDMQRIRIQVQNLEAFCWAKIRYLNYS